MLKNEAGPEQERPATAPTPAAEAPKPLEQRHPQAFIGVDDLAALFGCSDRTIRNMVSRYDLPPPIDLAGRNVWIVGRLLDWFDTMAEAEEKPAAAARAKVLRLGA